MFCRSAKNSALNEREQQIDQFWLLVAAIIVWLLTARNLLAAYPDHTSITHRMMAGAAVLGIFGSFNLHELIRARMMQRLGAGARGQAPPSIAADIWGALAGPVTSLALAAALGAGYALAQGLAPGTPAARVMAYLSAMNGALALIALFPAFPLDGGRLLRSGLWRLGHDFQAATQLAQRIGRFLTVALLLAGGALVFWGSFNAGAGLILGGCLLMATARAERRQNWQSAPLAERTVAEAMTPDPITVSPDMTLSHIVNQVVLRHRVNFLPVVENGVLLGKIDSDLIAEIDREHWASTKADDIFAELRGDRLLSPATPLIAVLDLITRTGQRKFLVTESQRLIGVLTLADLTRFMMLA